MNSKAPRKITLATREKCRVVTAVVLSALVGWSPLAQVATPPLFRPGDIPNGLQGYWKFDGNANDSSPNGYHLANSGTPSYVINDYWGSGERSGIAESLNHWTIAGQNCPKLSLAESSFSMVAWVKIQSWQQFYNIILAKSAQSIGYAFYTAGAGYLNVDNGRTRVQTANPVLSLGKWHHVAAVYDRISSMVVLFVDGNAVHVQAISGDVAPNSWDFNVGYSSGAPSAVLAGSIKDLAIWNRPLTPLEVKSLALGVDLEMLAFRPGNVSVPPTHWWKLNEVAGNRADSAPTNRLSLAENPSVLASGGYLEGTAAKFSGASYLSAPNSPDFKFGTGDFSIGTWFNASSFSGDTIIMDCSVFGGGGWAFGINSPTRIMLNLGGSSQNQWVYVTVPTLAVNTWYHLVVERASGVTRTYLDGIQVDSRADTFNYQPTRQLDLGDFFYTFADSHHLHFNGRLQDAFIWKGYALTTNEIASLATGLPVQNAGVVSYWKLDEKSDRRKDSVGSNHLTDNNGVGSAPGVVGNAAHFERGKSQFLSTAGNPGSGLDITNETYSIAAWINPNTIVPSQAILGKWDARAGYFFRLSHSELELTHNNGGNNDTAIITTAAWQHAAVSWIPGVNEGLFWKNGIGPRLRSVVSPPSPTANEFRLGGDSKQRLLRRRNG